MRRTSVLALALLVIGGIAFLTVRMAIVDGLNARVVVSVLLLTVLGVGVLGALTAPPDE